LSLLDAPVRSISMVALKYAPSSIMMRAVVKSPTTEPSFDLMRSRARKFSRCHNDDFARYNIGGQLGAITVSLRSSS
jgi:hypothetical protein